MWKQIDKLASEQRGRDPNSPPLRRGGRCGLLLRQTPVSWHCAALLVVSGCLLSPSRWFGGKKRHSNWKKSVRWLFSSQKMKQNRRFLVYVSVYMMVEKQRLLGKCPGNGRSWKAPAVETRTNGHGPVRWPTSCSGDAPFTSSIYKTPLSTDSGRCRCSYVSWTLDMGESEENYVSLLICWLYWAQTWAGNR